MTRICPPSTIVRCEPSEITLAEALREQGYKTFYAGKWHIGGKGSWPEDHRVCDINKGGWDVGSPRGGFSRRINPTLESGPPGESLPIRLGNETAKFIEALQEQAVSRLPFVLLPCTAPSRPRARLWKNIATRLTLRIG